MWVCEREHMGQTNNTTESPAVALMYAVSSTLMPNCSFTLVCAELCKPILGAYCVGVR
jgi:hypothetical protein